jgi:type IX secretion system PorP/SprF family membrane protein
MLKHTIIILFLFLSNCMRAQEVSLPPDNRQHNLTQYNSSLFNPTFSLDRNNPQSLSLWVRWQWQQIDADPTTVFANYSHRLNSNSAFGIGFYEQNTGVFLQTGGVLNYAYAFNTGSDFRIALGLNVFGFQQELADDRFQQSPNNGLPFLNNEDAFVLQAAPGIQLGYRNLSFGFAVENALDYNVTAGENNNPSNEMIYLGSASYAFSIGGAGILEEAYLRPMLFIKSLPGFDTQYGINTIFSTQKLWAQAGYHNFYGVSGGLGGTFFKKLSIGALVEIGTSTELDAKEPTFEIITSYHFGAPDIRKKVVGFKIDENEKRLADESEAKNKEEEIEAVKEKKLSRKERKALALEQQIRRQDSLVNAKRQQDSLALARTKAAEAESKRLAAELQRQKDSTALAEAAKEEKAKAEIEVEPKKGERFEEAVLTEDILPGFYLIANVFGTQRYFQSFMKNLKDRGLNPKSFYRTQRKLNYVYLERYDSIEEARKARDSGYFGKYKDEIWIFRVKAGQN